MKLTQGQSPCFAAVKAAAIASCSTRIMWRAIRRCMASANEVVLCSHHHRDHDYVDAEVLQWC